MNPCRILGLWAASVAVALLGLTAPALGAVVPTVKVGFMQYGGHAPDCAFYPPPLGGTPASSGAPHFPDPGCTHTPDRGALDRCIDRLFSTRGAVQRCIDLAVRPCHDSQMDINLCVENIEVYLEETVRQRLRTGSRSPLNVNGYDAWIRDKIKGCEATSDFNPDAAGYGADIGLCVSYETMRLLQRRLFPADDPFRPARGALR